MIKPSRLLARRTGRRARVRDARLCPADLGRGRRFSRFSARFAKLEDFDGSFLYCRGFFGSGRGGGGWTTDYPGADNNFSIRLAELTRVTVKFDVNRQPHHVVVRLDDPTLFRCPMLFMENVENLRFTESEVVGLRDYLVKGGFLWVDDFWGSRPGRTGRTRSHAFFRRRSIPSSISPSRTRSCTPCTT